jgi:hypothetical protein
MKINQWTLGLTAVGAVSIATVVTAEEVKMNALQTALSSTTISGYVDTSIEWGLDNTSTYNYGNIQDLIPFRGSGNSKADGFNLNIVKLSIEKPMDESEWASGYKVDLLFGPDAVNYNTSFNAVGGNSQQHFAGENGADFAIKQAYVALRTPVGNGIDWKVGVFDTVIGYETFEAGNNPNFSRSWGYAIEPTQHTGILATYRLNDSIAIAAGVANTLNAGINDRPINPGETWHKTAMASIAVTAPQDCGFASGSTLYAGAVVGINNSGSPFVGFGNDDQANYYAGVTLNTPVAHLKVGAAFDYASNFGGSPFDAWVAGAYASYQATDKLSLHARAEYGEFEAAGLQADSTTTITSLTGTAQYDLWKNVISRLELRWDQAHDRNGFDLDINNNVTTYSNTGLSLYANFIYKF